MSVFYSDSEVDKRDDGQNILYVCQSSSDYFIINLIA